jgi:hypothetical protein
MAVRIERKKVGMASVRRDAVKPGQIFALLKKDGSLGEKAYIDVGNNGKHLSINADSGELSSTADGAKAVAIVGKAEFVTKRFPAGDEKATTREQVQVGEIFRAKGKSTLYAHMGDLSDGRLASLNLEDPFNNNYAVTKNADSSLDKNVEVVGTWEIVGSRV